MSTAAPITPTDLPEVKTELTVKPAAPKPASKKAAPKPAAKKAPKPKLVITQADLALLVLVPGIHKTPKTRHFEGCMYFGSEKGKGYKDPDWKPATKEQMKTLAACGDCARRAAKNRIAKAAAKAK